MTRLKTGSVGPKAQQRKTCSNGHPWREKTTRWRQRIRDGRVVTERDCLVCKRESDHQRRTRRLAEQHATTGGAA